MTTVFPTELPDRPGKTPKLGLTKRLTQRLTIKRKNSEADRVNLSSATAPSTITTPVAFSDHGVPYPHVLPPQRPGVSPTVAPSGISPFSSRALLRSSTDSNLVLPPHTSSSALSSTQTGTVPARSGTHRKSLPLLNPEKSTKDPLIERFSRLRFSQSKNSRSTSIAPRTFISRPLPANPAPPLTLFRSQTTPTTTRQVAWQNMAMSNPTLPRVEQEPRPPVQRQNTYSFRRTSLSTGTEVPQMNPINLENESSTTVAPDRLSNISKTNYFQTNSRGRPYQRFRTPLKRRKNKRRSRSPGSSSSDSEQGVIAGLSNVAYPDLTARTALIIQEEQDRQLAEQLQQEEDETHEAIQSLFHEELSSSANQQRASPSGSNRKRPFSNMKNAFRRRGTRENPINLDSDTDSDSDSDPEELDNPARGRARTQDCSAIDEDLMDLDELNLAQASYLHVQQDEAMARKLQAEFEDQSTPSMSRDCVVCGDSFLIVELPALANCAHRPETCAGCYEEWIANQLQDSSWREVKCPGNGCKIQLEYHEIQEYAAPEVFQQYDTYIARAAFSEDPNFRWCRACNSGQIHLSGVEGNIFTCASCGHKCCIIHENTWHEGETCDEYDYRSSGQKERDQKAQEEASKAAIDELSKKCPGKGCVYNIEKNDGCDHMTCSKCRYEFCWICLCDYNAVRRKGNSAHAEHCKYHSARLR